MQNVAWHVLEKWAQFKGLKILSYESHKDPKVSVYLGGNVEGHLKKDTMTNFTFRKQPTIYSIYIFLKYFNIPQGVLNFKKYVRLTTSKK